MADRLPTLIAGTPQDGCDLAVKMTRPAAAARAGHAEEAEALIASGRVMGPHFATVAAANGSRRMGP